MGATLDGAWTDRAMQEASLPYTVRNIDAVRGVATRARASTDALDFGDREAVLRHVSTLDPSRDGLLVEPAAPGDALAFYNFEANGAPDMHALHAGVEVGAGETKWVASHFFRAPGVVTPAVLHHRRMLHGRASRGVVRG